MKTEHLPFNPDMIPAAGELLAARHRRDRKVFPCLPERFETPEAVVVSIQELLKRKNTSGYMAIRSTGMVAYLLGTANVQPWGRCGWVYLPGSALAEGESPATLQDLYTLLSDDWVK